MDVAAGGRGAWARDPGASLNAPIADPSDTLRTALRDVRRHARKRRAACALPAQGGLSCERCRRWKVLIERSAKRRIASHGAETPPGDVTLGRSLIVVYTQRRHQGDPGRRARGHKACGVGHGLHRIWAAPNCTFLPGLTRCDAVHRVGSHQQPGPWLRGLTRKLRRPPSSSRCSTARRPKRPGFRFLKACSCAPTRSSRDRVARAHA